MAIFFITGAIAGIILGLRFKVLVVIPAILLATVVIIVSGSGDKLSAIVLTVVGTAVSLQIGYIVGSILRALARAYLPARMRVVVDAPGRNQHVEMRVAINTLKCLKSLCKVT